MDNNDLGIPLPQKDIFNKVKHSYSKSGYYSTLHKKWSFPLRISSVNVTKIVVMVEEPHKNHDQENLHDGWLLNLKVFMRY